MSLLQTTTLSNQNISSNLLVATYTADAERRLMLRVFVDQVAGGGDYDCFVCIRRLGAGSTYRTVPITAATVASGVTSVGFIGIPFWVQNTDVVTVYVKGLTGDTTTPDIITEFWDDIGHAIVDSLANDSITAAVVAAAAIDADAIADGAITAAKVATGAIDADAIADGAIDAGAIASNAITAAKIATGAIDADAIATDAVTEIQAGLATPATTWAYATRTLTQTAASVAAAVAGSTITIMRGDTLSASLTGLGATAGYVSIDFTVKRGRGATDNDAIIRIRKNASGLSDGLLRLNGAAVDTATEGSLTIGANSVTVALKATSTDDLTAEAGLFYDVQMITATTVTTLTEGTLNVTEDVTRAVS